MNLRERITEIGQPLIEAGKTPAQVRQAIWEQLGVGIGGGAGGGTYPGMVETPPCDYCGQTGNGGHGGMCPNGSGWHGR